jgi:hypothetical protein
MPPDSSRGSTLWNFQAHQPGLGHPRIGLRARHVAQVQRQRRSAPPWPRASAWLPGTPWPASVRACRPWPGCRPTSGCAVRRLFQPGEHLQQGALAAARGPQQRDELAAPDIEPDLIQRACRCDRSSPPAVPTAPAAATAAPAGPLCSHAAACDMANSSLSMESPGGFMQRGGCGTLRIRRALPAMQQHAAHDEAGPVQAMWNSWRRRTSMQASGSVASRISRSSTRMGASQAISSASEHLPRYRCDTAIATA